MLCGTTTASTRFTFFCASYSTVTWDFPSASGKGTSHSCELRRVQSKFVAREIGSGISSGLIAGVAEHHALSAGAARVHAHGDVAGLFIDARNHAQVLESKP